MIDESVARPGQESPPSVERIADRIEVELDRLRRKRPHLEARLDRAAGIIVMHLACPRQKIIRVRLRGSDYRFLVSSHSSEGELYEVDPTGWRCSCPDANRHAKGCKHALSCWLLWRVAQPVLIRKRTCCGCDRRFPSGEVVEVGEDNMTFYEGDPLCVECARAHGVI